MIHHPKFNMEPKHEGLVQMMFLFIWVIFRFHVNFPGCNHCSISNKNRPRVLHHCGYMVYALWTKPCHVCLGEILSIPFPMGSMYGTYIFLHLPQNNDPNVVVYIYITMTRFLRVFWDNKKHHFHLGRPPSDSIQSIQIHSGHRHMNNLLGSKCSTTKNHHQDLFQLKNPRTHRTHRVFPKGLTGCFQNLHPSDAQFAMHLRCTLC